MGGGAHPPAAQHWGCGLASSFCPQWTGMSPGVQTGSHRKGWGQGTVVAWQHSGLRRREPTSQSIWPRAAQGPRDSIRSRLGRAVRLPGPTSGWGLGLAPPGSGPTSHLVLFGDGEGPRAWQLGHFPGLSRLPRAGTPRPAPGVREARCLSLSGAWLGPRTELALRSHSPRPALPGHWGGPRMGLLGACPRLFPWFLREKIQKKTESVQATREKGGGDQAGPAGRKSPRGPGTQ